MSLSELFSRFALTVAKANELASQGRIDSEFHSLLQQSKAFQLQFGQKTVAIISKLHEAEKFLRREKDKAAYIRRITDRYRQMIDEMYREL